MAEARLTAIQEELTVKSLEFERTNAQLEQRHVVAPIDGIVTDVYKDQGEFVSPNDPTVLRIVQLDPLLIVFSVPVTEASTLAADQTARVQIDGSEASVPGTVEFVSPLADVQSGTVRVRVRVSNPGEQIPSGATCRLLLGAGNEELAKAR
jgi:RND family efflux transporter MFP subunit